jgi:transposase
MTNERVEVITSVERRRRWSFAEKRQLVAATLEPGASVSAVAREAGIHPSQLFGWRRQMRAPAPSGFTPVQIAGEAPSTTAGLVGLGTIEIEFAAGARMRISGAVDAATLTAVVAALTRGRPR